MEREDPLASEVSVQAQLDQSGLKLASKSRAVAALDRLIGNIIDMPGSYIEGIVRRRRARDEAEEQLARSTAAVKIEGATELERLQQRTNWHEQSRKLQQQVNREEVAILAIEDLRESPPEGDVPGDIDTDWLNKFVRLSEEASSDRLRILYSKILSGEIRHPGSFSPSTLRVVSELTQSLAEDFAWAWAKNIGFEIWRGPEFDSGEPWTKLRKLRDAGLLSPVDAAIHQPPFNPVSVQDLNLTNSSLWQIGPHGPIFLWIAMTGQLGVRLNVVNFTQAGLELSTILPAPDYEANLRSLAAGFPKQGVAWIRLRKDNQDEGLWP